MTTHEAGFERLSEFTPPGSEFINAIKTSDGIVGVFRIDNGTPEGEDRIAMLPQHFPLELVSGYVPTNNFKAHEMLDKVFEASRYTRYWLGLNEPEGLERRPIGEVLGDSKQAVGNIAQGVVDVVGSVVDRVDNPLELGRQAAVSLAVTGVIGLGIAGIGERQSDKPQETVQEQSKPSDSDKMPIEVRKISFEYVPKKPTHLLAIANDTEVPVNKLEQMNPDYVSHKEVPAGAKVKVEAPAGIIKITEPVKVSKIAKQTGLSDDAVRSANQIDEKGRLLAGEVHLPGRVVVPFDDNASNLHENISAIADQLDVKPNKLEHVNKFADAGTLVVPLTDEANAEEIHSQVTQVVSQLPSSISSLPEVESTTSTVASTITSTAITPPTSETPSTTAAPPESTTTSVVPETTVPTPEKVTDPLLPQEHILNESLKSVDIHAESNDLTYIVESVKALDAAVSPGGPEGYVKQLLPNEAPGVTTYRTVAQRTTDAERFTSPQAEATSRAISVALEQFKDKYPQYGQVYVRLRDADSPFHKTHANGQMMDFSTALTILVTQYSDGPIGDKQFSKNYNIDFSADVLAFMYGLRVGDVPAISKVISSDQALVNRVNKMLGAKFMIYDDKEEHNDHWHIIMNTAFNLPSQGLRAKNMPLTTEQDLWVGNRAQQISPEKDDELHGQFHDWQAQQLINVANLLEAAATQTTASQDSIPVTPQTLTSSSVPELPKSPTVVEVQTVYDALMQGLIKEIINGEAKGDTIDAVNTGHPGDTKVGSEKYKQIFGDRKLSDLTIVQVMDLQAKGKIFAVGELQFIPDTLKSAIKVTGIDTNTIFDKATQEKLGVDYLIMSKRKPVANFITGKSDDIAAAVKALSQEWASLPGMNGKGYYDGDSAGNHAGGGIAKRDRIIGLLKSLRDTHVTLETMQQEASQLITSTPVAPEKTSSPIPETSTTTTEEPTPTTTEEPSTKVHNNQNPPDGMWLNEKDIAPAFERFFKDADGKVDRQELSHWIGSLPKDNKGKVYISANNLSNMNLSKEN